MHTSSSLASTHTHTHLNQPNNLYFCIFKKQQLVAQLAVEGSEPVPNLTLKPGVDEIALIEARRAQSGGSDVRGGVVPCRALPASTLPKCHVCGRGRMC